MSVLIWILWKLAWAIAAIAALFCVFVAGERDTGGQRKIGNLMLFALVVALALWALVHTSWGSLAALYVFPMGLLWWGFSAPLSILWGVVVLAVLWGVFAFRPETRRYSVAGLGGCALAVLIWLWG